MKHGHTNKHTTGHFYIKGGFDIPEGTPVVWGESDCDGEPMQEWTLPEEVARHLSGDSHASKHYFIVVHPDNVKEKES